MDKIEHSGNGHGHTTETPDVSHIKNIDVTHETSDVNIGGIVKFVVALTIFGIIVQVLMWGMFDFLNAQAEKEPPPGPMAMTELERLPPEPRLQAAKGFGVKLENGQWVSLENREPQAEYRELREQWERRLNCQFGDTSQGTVAESDRTTIPADQSVVRFGAECLSIDQAMQKILEADRLRSRKQEDLPNGAADYEESMPSASSSGREPEKRKLSDGQ